jgi:predicted nucleic acid-binding protein
MLGARRSAVVLIRRVARQRIPFTVTTCHPEQALDELRSCDGLVSSELIATESARTIDRLRLQGTLTVEEAAARRRAITEWLDAIDLVLLRAPVLSRAGGPLPTPLGTVDAIHLATALIWRERVGALSTIATHDAALALAARTFGFDVLGA